MNNIKFKGKSVISNDLIYGCLFIDSDKRHFIVHELVTKEPYYSEIHSDSVGQFIGLTDTNGVEMFSKDKALYKGFKGAIEWEQQAAAFWFKWDEKSESGRVFHKYKELSATFSDGEVYQCDYIEIIGNQYQQ